ncbi:hypothetical protein DTW90_14505 [Neorhizobium sp. P12A]|uniref:hypothetical protein n=1 Tax=Neorhizobium sp. P12A TaxID=2268027 RepID=UPI0011F0379C|nr:hypothetical protein [Neorhizobium sp. P12A]KAA0698103.1 hypothetical protein DTW90_14505 [Neorhizobium sp. P12A]
MAETKPIRIVKRKLQRRKAREEHVYYVIAINDWEWSYSFSSNHMKDRHELYNEYRHLHLIGKLLRPSQTKVETVRLTFLPNDAYNRDQWDRQVRAYVGTISLYRSHMDGLFSLPSDILPNLLTMLTADKIRFAVLHGAKLHRGRADITGFRLEKSVNDDDLPPEG